MSKFSFFHKDERGQTALETAIILIAFVVVASVFAFTILSAGSSSTEKGEAAIYSGLENVQSSMAVKGAVIAKEGETEGQVGTVTFTVALAGGGEPLDLTDTADDENAVVISYRDATAMATNIDWTVKFLVGDDDKMLEEGELAEITATIPANDGATAPVDIALAANSEFTLEVKPPSGAVLNITRTTPAAIEAVMELR